MGDFKIVGSIDLTLLIFSAFVLFFIGLIVYLQREGRREGYPLEDEATGRVDTPGGFLSIASPKTFKMPFGRPDITVPNNARDTLDRPWKRTFRSPGAPYYPTGNPLVDGIGPAAWADRAKHTDLDGEGRNRIVPIGATQHIAIHARDADPRGMSVIAADGLVAGTVTDIWVDRAEHMIRYLEVDTGSGKVLAPMAMAKVKSKKGQIEIDAINAADFAAAPVPGTAGQITFYEEERIVAYFGGGYLYANSERQDPLI
jgi:photosynthetic reaction center H subunit